MSTLAVKAIMGMFFLSSLSFLIAFVDSYSSRFMIIGHSNLDDDGGKKSQNTYNDYRRINI
jgi:hypothetical protein